jgi:hypothetical protein
MTFVRATRVLAWILRPSLDLVAFAILACSVAVWDALYRPRFFDECYALALVFQMFAASTAFRERAVRGHFDLLLTRAPRALVAAAHLAVSIAPGLLVWMVVVAADGAGLHRVPTGLRAPPLVALSCVSLIAWAAGLVLPRYGAGLLWLATIVIIAGSGYAGRVRTDSFAGRAEVRFLARGVGFLAAPMLLVADPIAPSVVIVAMLAACAAAAAACGAAYVIAFDAALQELT